MSKIHFLLTLTIFWTLTGAAATYRFNRARTTSAQENEFTRTELRAILEPEGFHLDPLSIDIREEVALLSLSSPVILETREYAIHSVRFEASRDGKSYSGNVYLVLANPDRLQSSSLKDKMILNSTSKNVVNYAWTDDSTTTMALAIGYELELFRVEIRPQNLKLILRK